MELQVSPPTVDWDALFELVHSAFAAMEGRIDPPSSIHRMSAADFEQKAADETLITATADGRLVGCLFCAPKDEWMYVGKMAVAIDSQGLGIGRQMIELVRGLANARDLRGLELETRLELVENHAAFAKLGFLKFSENSHEGYDRPTSITMRALLLPS